MEYFLVASGLPGGVIVAIVFGGIFMLAINYYIAYEFMKVAKDKGYYSQKYLWITFFLNIIGMLLVIALPNKKQNVGTSYDEAPSKLPRL